MKKIFFTLVIILGMSTISFSQEDVSIMISKSIETVNGQKFYLHKVEKGQTLYSISKIYQVDIKTLEADTHNLNLKIGQILYIPYKQENQAKNIAVYDTVSKTHIVLSKETLYGIS